MKRYILITTFLLLTACENQPVRREEMVYEHPEWNQEMVTLIKNGYLAVGMTQDQVRASWGRPCLTCVGTTRGAWGEAWEYATQVVFFDSTGKVTRWTQK